MSTGLILSVTALTIAGILFRPFRWPEYVFALLGAGTLVLTGLIAPERALAAVRDGTQVYLFLGGMMLLAETARREGVFAWLAARAARLARGSAERLFLITYGVGILVTVFLSNDATAVVLTPAVYATAREARVAPMPYLFACALIANAASFVLPISNPANLVVYADALPPLGAWLQRFLLPSAVAIVATYVALRFAMRRELTAAPVQSPSAPRLGTGGRLTLLGLGLTALILFAVSAAGRALGWPTLLAGLAVVLAVTLATRRSPGPLLRHVSWGVLPLVAGLFVLVQAVFATDLPATAVAALQHWAQAAPGRTAWGTGVVFALASNVINNLPVGLVAATAAQAGQLPPQVVDAMLIGVDLGPNLSVTGSLATVLWLLALRREGHHVSAGQFFRVGLIVMPPALLLSLLALVLSGS
jgi:arsenical pump membrane protein